MSPERNTVAAPLYAAVVAAARTAVPELRRLGIHGRIRCRARASHVAVTVDVTATWGDSLRQDIALARRHVVDALRAAGLDVRAVEGDVRVMGRLGAAA